MRSQIRQHRKGTIVSAMLTAFVLALGVAVLVPHAARASTNPVTAGDSQTNCFVLAGGTYGEISTANLASVESTTGMTVNCLETFNNPAATWDAWDAPWQFTNGQPSGTESWNNWVAAGNSMILGEDLIPQAVDSGNWEASCAAGNYDSYATTLAQNLISYGAGNITIRLGIEANGNWETDYVGTNPSAWATCYDNEVSAMRAVSGAHFLFVWNPNACYSDAASGGDLSSWYPGNSYVDIIAADDYDTDCTNSDTVAQEGFSAYASNGSPSLDSIQSFAESNGKPLAIPEWGLESGDDPAYVNGISSVLHSTTSGWSFQSYFDDGDGAQELTSTYPNSVAAYQSGFADSGSTTPPAAPAKLQASVNGDSVTLSWSPVSGATSYEVRVSGYAIQVVTMSDGVYADDTTTTPSLTLNNLPTTEGNGGDYWWGVAAVNSAGKTWDAQTAAGNANEFVVSTTPPTPPAAPAKLQASVNGDSVTLSWSPVSGATSYEVRVSGYAIQVVTMSDGVYADDTTTTPSLTLNNLPTTEGNGGDYWWGVAAVNSAGKTWDAQTAAGNANEFVVS